ncbi:hypothetical protein E2562_031180 [Oryza meyeriana var. granulata]|uniref:Uncharacterized protein n=1 Tax=Oryza meyeriana var. granulata TaxID=110450 RepID=A0A6G1ERI6_9ORYZ|nr:hypothetical protein E2562_031180 [Oryza meyeriana var. granulata]
MAGEPGVCACCKARSSRQRLEDGTTGPRGGMQKTASSGEGVGSTLSTMKNFKIGLLEHEE